MQNLIRVSAQSLVIQPTNNGCYAPVQVDSSARENQLAQLFNAVNLQPERKQPESNMENLVDVFAGAFAQCRISVDFQQVEYHETEIAFVFVTYDNMLSNPAVIACQYIGEQLTGQLRKPVTVGTKRQGAGWKVIVWAEK